MTREVTIVTPENVTLTYELAGLGSRAIAQLVDILLLAAALLALFLSSTYVVSQLVASAPGSPFLRTLSDLTAAITIIVAFAAFVGYFTYFEATRNGQTPGKKWLGLRVVREEGAPVDFSAAAVRNLIRIIELTLGFYIVSLAFILFSPRYKRVGDYAAGTIVVKERRPVWAVPLAQPVRRSAATTAEAALVRDVDLLTRDEVAAIRRFVERRSQLAPHVQEEVARQMAEPIMARLGIVPPDTSFSCANFLEEVFNRTIGEK